MLDRLAVWIMRVAGAGAVISAMAALFFLAVWLHS